jgi:hypothetical protein
LLQERAVRRFDDHDLCELTRQNGHVGVNDEVRLRA